MKIIDFTKKVSLVILVLYGLFLNSSCQNSQTLFQENDTTWKQTGNATWSFSNNELIGTVKDETGFIFTEESYTNFVLELEFKPDSTINSGVFIRCKDENLSPTNCYEANIWDLHPNQDYRTGAIVAKSVPLIKVETNGTWNSYKIRAEKDRIQVWVNTVLTADIRDSGLAEGYIGLQAGGTGEIRFRNAKITPLEVKE